MEREENVDEMLLRKQAAEYLWSIGNKISSACPAASRFFMTTLERKLNEYPHLMKKSNKMYCRHCGSIWHSENCRIRILPCPRRNRHIAKLQKMEANEPWKLNIQQKKKLRKFYESKSKTVYRCLSCKKKTTFPGSKTRNIKYKSVKCTSTPLPKVKLNKSDMNAGLFIPSPCLLRSNEKNNLKESQVPVKTPVLEQKYASKCENKATVTSYNFFKNQVPSSLKYSPAISSNSRKQSASKKKKSLFEQILNQEQNMKKKISLSSFLVSL